MINKDFVRFGGGGETLLTPMGLCFLVLASLLIFAVRRKYLIAPLLLGCILIPLSERVVLFGLHFTCVRILIACAWVRVLRSSVNKRLTLSKVDKATILWASSAALTFILLWASMDALRNRLGLLYDCFGIYFLLRILLNNESSVYRAFRIMALVSFTIGICMTIEHFRDLNLFSVFGGVARFSDIREGHIRAQGPFGHAILAGCFGATLMPLFAGMWWQKKSHWSSAMGMLGASAMTFSSFSSTAILAWTAGLAALLLWPIRGSMQVLRRSIVFALLALHLVMKAPVWSLIGRIDLAGGSSGYHRFELVNQTILHFSDWWLLGEKTTYQWGYNLWDTANTYVETAITGGLSTLLLLVAIIVFCFKALGEARKRLGDRGAAKLPWILGAALFAHLTAFVGITYYDQTVISWYLILAMICAITSTPHSTRAGQEIRNVKLSNLPEDQVLDTWPVHSSLRGL
jgi:hypothetical protein